MKMNERHGYAKLEHKTLRSLFNHPIIVLLSHWIFQGMPYMDSSERWFKIGLDLVSTILIGLFLAIYLPWLTAFLIAFLLSHTLNFLFNGHLWAALRFFGVAFYNFEEFKNYLGKLSNRIESEYCFFYAAAYGSIVRKEWDRYSDLDIRLVRNRGFINCLRACTFVLKERTRALLTAFPLDIYVFDDFNSLSRLRDDEIPKIIRKS